MQKQIIIFATVKFKIKIKTFIFCNANNKFLINTYTNGFLKRETFYEFKEN